MPSRIVKHNRGQSLVGPATRRSTTALGGCGRLGAMNAAANQCTFVDPEMRVAPIATMAEHTRINPKLAENPVRYKHPNPRTLSTEHRTTLPSNGKPGNSDSRAAKNGKRLLGTKRERELLISRRVRASAPSRFVIQRRGN